MAFVSRKRLGRLLVALAALGSTLAAPGAWATADEPFLAEINWVAFDFVPRGWAACNGQILPIAQNQALFALLGNTYGGNGQTTFALPDLRGRAPIHVSNGHTLGERGGAESHTLTVSEMPAHTHAMGVDPKEATDATADASSSYLAKTSGGTSAYAVTATTSLHAGAIGSEGGSQPHTNMKPFIALKCIIALQGLFPSQN